MNTPENRVLLLENTLDILATLRDTTNMTSAMAVLNEDRMDGEVIASLAGNCDHCYVPRVGSHFELHSTAPGKSLMAFHPKSKRDKFTIRLDYKQFTSKTCTSPLELDKLLDQDHEQGFSIDIGEYVEGINCIASCVCDTKDHPIFAIWITAMSMDLPVAEIPTFTKPVLRAVKDMELRLENAFGDTSSHTDAILKDAKSFIEDHYLKAEVIQDYFDNLSLSYSWFRKLFKDKYGVAPMKYRHELLHKRAQRLLKNTNLSIKEIAFQLNYDSQNYFSRAFKKQEGLSPQQFREKVQ